MLKDKYNPCTICGFDCYTENHHIDPIQEVLILYYEGNHVATYKYDTKLEDLLKNGNKNQHFVVTRKFENSTEKTTPLCKNCHVLFHKYKLTYKEIKEYYKNLDMGNKITKTLLLPLPEELLVLSQKDIRRY